MTGLTYEERLDHPSRCTARRQDGEPCGKFATVGASVCYVHGGWAPHIRRAGLVRKMEELDAKAQYEAAINVLLPPELHKLVGGGGRGHKKAPAPEPVPPPRHQKPPPPFVIDAERVRPPRVEPRLPPPDAAVAEMRGPFPTEPLPENHAPATGPQLTTLEDAVAEQARARTRVRRGTKRRF